MSDREQTGDRDKERGGGTNAAALRLRERMAELRRSVRKDDEKERDQTRDRDVDRKGPER